MRFSKAGHGVFRRPAAKEKFWIEIEGLLHSKQVVTDDVLAFTRANRHTLRARSRADCA
jgi:hypothetical protein